MAQRRMFTTKITESDAFLDMPASSQMLYFHLSMNADDDGFVNNPKKIMRMCGAKEDDFKLLLAKNFVIVFDSGVIVIKHWRMHNYIRSDRYKPTDYTEEKAMLSVKENEAYTLDTAGIPKVSLSKDSIGKVNTESMPPSIEEVNEYCIERKNGIDPQRFIDYYSARGWVLNNGRKMVSWKAAVRTWETRNKEKTSGKDYNRMVMDELFGGLNDGKAD